MSLWQTHSWQKMLKKSWQIEQFFELSWVFVEKRQVSFGEFGLFVLGIPSPQLSQNLFWELKDLCKRENCLFIQVETLDYFSGDTQLDFSKEQNFQKWYYKKFIPPYTALIDLSRAEEEILTFMKPKGRYNIRLAEKKWVVVEQVEKTPYHISIFHKLMQETTQRDNFAGNSLQYYETFLWEVVDSQLFFAYFEKNVIAAWIFVTTGESMLYYYGASSSEHRNLMAPYLLQWTALSHAKKRECTLYDFLGIASPGDKNSPLIWVTDFKLKFTSDIKKVSESYIFVNKKWKYRLISFLKKWKKR